MRTARQWQIGSKSSELESTKLDLSLTRLSGTPSGACSAKKRAAVSGCDYKTPTEVCMTSCFVPCDSVQFECEIPNVTVLHE